MFSRFRFGKIAKYATDLRIAYVDAVAVFDLTRFSEHGGSAIVRIVKLNDTTQCKFVTASQAFSPAHKNIISNQQRTGHFETTSRKKKNAVNLVAYRLAKPCDCDTASCHLKKQNIERTNEATWRWMRVVTGDDVSRAETRRAAAQLGDLFPVHRSNERRMPMRDTSEIKTTSNE